MQINIRQGTDIFIVKRVYPIPNQDPVLRSRPKGSDIIDPKKELIKHRLFRDSCLLVEGNYLKDLNVLGRDLTKAVLVDNSPHAFGYQVDNGIPIESWFDDPADTELLKLADFLDTIQSAEDVRPLVRNHFKTHELIAKAQDR